MAVVDILLRIVIEKLAHGAVIACKNLATLPGAISD
jgi:hypothetical protein